MTSQAYGDRYCPMHGYYYGPLCPSCSTVHSSPQPQAVALDPVPTLARIAGALERIAAALESGPESSRE